MHPLRALFVCFAIVLGWLALVPSGQAAAFTPGNIVILRVGDGSSSNTTTTTSAGFLVEYTPTGTLVQTIAIPATGGGQATVSGGAQEGLLARTADGSRLYFGGYRANAGSTAGGSAPGTVPRVMAYVDAAGSINTATAASDATGQIKSVTSAGGTGAIYMITGSGGVRVMTGHGSLSTTTQIEAINARQAVMVGTSLFASNTVSGTAGVRSYGASLPMGATASTLLTASGPAASGFVALDVSAGVAGQDTLYVANTPSSGQCTIEKYCLNGGAWTAAGSLNLPTNSAHWNLTGTVSGSTATLYLVMPGFGGTTSTVHRLVDSSGFNGTLSGTISQIAASPANTDFRGIALAPVASPVTVTSLNRANATPSNAATVNWTLTFPSAVTNVASGNFSLSGTASSGASVGTPTTGNGGVTWNVPVTTGSGNGILTLTMANTTGTNPAVSNVPFGGQSYSMDKMAPVAPVTITPANASTTSDNTPTYTGTAEVNASVTIIVDDVAAGNTTADASGNWSYTPTIPLADGDHTVKARAADALGNTSGDSNANFFAVDTTPPPAPVVQVPANGSVTGDNTPSYGGTAEPGSTVTVIVDGTAVGTAVANGAGDWGLTPVPPLPDAAHTVRARATDQAGNTSPDSGTNTFTVDTIAPTVTINQAGGQADPASTSPINFTVAFNEAVTGFGNGDLTLSGTAGATTAVVTGGPSTYNVAVSGMSGNGTVIASVKVNAAKDAAGNDSAASTSTDNTVTYSPAPTYDITLSLAGNALTIDGSTSAGAANLTLRYSTAAGGPYLEVADTARTVGGSAGTSVNANTMRVPISAFTSISVLGSTQADAFALDFSAGDICPAGGISVNGGTPTVAPGDSIRALGTFATGSSYGPGGPGAGSLVLGAGNAVTFTSVEAVDLSSASFSNFTVEVDPTNTFAGNVTTTVAAVDAGANTLISFSGNLSPVKLGAITGTLTINGDNVHQDYFLVNGIGSTTAGHLMVDGRGGDADVIDIHDTTVASAAGKDLTLRADFIGIGRNTTGLNPGVMAISGNLTLEANGDNSITTPPIWGSGGVWGTSVPSYFSSTAPYPQRGYLYHRGRIVKGEGPDATAVLRARAGIVLHSATMSTAGTIESLNNKLHVVLHADSDASGDGPVFLDAGSSMVTNGGDVTIGGGADPLTGPAVGTATSLNAGVRIQNAVIDTVGGNVSIRGRGFAGVSSAGVSLSTASNHPVDPLITTGAGNIQIVGTGGGAEGASTSSHGFTMSGTTSVLKMARLLTTTGSINVTGIKSFSNTVSIVLFNQSDISSGSGNITLIAADTGAGSNIAHNSTTNSTQQVKSGGGDVTFISDYLFLAQTATPTTYVYETSGAGVIAIKPYTVGKTVLVGSDGAQATGLAGSLGVNKATLDQLRANTVIIGDGNSGPINVTQVIEPSTFGTLVLGKNATVNAAGGFNLDLTSASVFEKVTVNGNLTLNGTSVLTVNTLGGFVPAAGDRFALLTTLGASPITGTFAGKPEGTLVSVNGVEKRLTYLGGSGNDVVLKALTFAPTVTVAAASGVTSMAAGLNGNITSDGNDVITERGFVYALTATDADPMIGDPGVIKVIEGGTAVDVFSQSVAGLAPNTSYSYKAYAINATGTGYSIVETFSTTGAGAPAVDDGVRTGTGLSVVYPLANDPQNNATITGVSNQAITISADGRALYIPANFTGSFTYTTSLGTTATVDVVAGTPVVAPRKYNGLVYDNAGALAGWINASVSSRGAASAQVRVGALSGRAVFSFKATDNTVTANSTLGALTLTRNADGTLAAQLVATGGTLTGTLFPAPLAVPAVKYHVSLASIDSVAPGGGYLRVTVTSTGIVRISSVMPDGRPFTVGTGLTDNGTITFYGKQSSGVNPVAVVGGQLVPANLAATDLTGEMLWNKPAQAPGARGTQRAGVDTILVANGSIYAGALPSGLTGAGTLTLSGGGFAVSEVNAVTLAGGVPAPVNSLKGWAGVKASAGNFRVRVQIPGVTRPVTGSGVYLPKSQSAWGYFPGTILGGRVELTAP